MEGTWTLRDTAAEREPAPFDAWLRRELRDQFSAVLREPVPDELTALLPA